MNKLTCSILIAATLASMNAAHAADLTIQIDEVKSANGSLKVALYGSAGDFLKKPLQSLSAKAVPGSNTLVIKDLPDGEYAFAVFHDVNANNAMDRNMMGIPTEDYAFSNNALGRMGPPAFEAARITLPVAGLSTRVSLK